MIENTIKDLTDMIRKLILKVDRLELSIEKLKEYFDGRGDDGYVRKDQSGGESVSCWLCKECSTWITGNKCLTCNPETLSTMSSLTNIKINKSTTE